MAESSRTTRARRAAAPWSAILASLCPLLAAEGTAAAPDPAPPPTRRLEWRVGRTPDVHRPDERLVSTRIGGWLDASYQDNDLDDQSSSTNLNHLNLFLDTRYRDAQLFVEVEFENQPDVSGFEEEREYEMEQAYVRLRRGDRLQLRLGQFNTPFGYWTPAHWSILMDTIETPIHDGNRIIPEQQIGLELSGRLFPGPALGTEMELAWALYSGYGEEHGLFEEPGTEGLSYGADLRVSLGSRYMLGTSLYLQRRRDEGDRSERNLMLYARADLPGRLSLRGEYARQLRDRHTRPTLSENINIAYAKLRWDFRRDAYLNYRYGFGDDDSTGTTLEEYIHTVTFGYRPLPALRIKLEWSAHRFRDPGRESFTYWGASVGYLF